MLSVAGSINILYLMII